MKAASKYMGMSYQEDRQETIARRLIIAIRRAWGHDKVVLEACEEYLVTF